MNPKLYPDPDNPDRSPFMPLPLGFDIPGHGRIESIHYHAGKGRMYLCSSGDGMVSRVLSGDVRELEAFASEEER